MFRMQKLLGVVLAALGVGLAGDLTLESRALADAQAPQAVREIQIVVDGAYKPNRIEVHEGERVQLKFVRRDYNGCTREVVFPELDIRRELPTDVPVIIEIPALAPGEYEFRCGMNMIRGTLRVHSHGHH